MQTSSAPTPRRAKDARQQRVHEAVRVLVREQGVLVSMDAVAARAGCSKQTLYSRYGCKRDLLRKAMQLHVSTATSALAVSSEKPLQEILLGFALGYLEHRNQPRVRQTAQVIVAGIQEFREESKFMYLGSVETLCDHMAEWMQTEIARGRLHHDDPQFMAELLLSMLAGQDFERQRFHVPHRDDAAQRRRWAEFAIDSFLRAFATHGDAVALTHKNNSRSYSS